MIWCATSIILFARQTVSVHSEQRRTQSRLSLHYRRSKSSLFSAPYTRRTYIAFLSVIYFIFPIHSFGQQFSYSNTSPAKIPDASFSCTNFLTRKIDVTDSFIISDINFGVVIDHTYKGDLLIALQSPSGTLVRVINQVGGSADDYNVLLKDDASLPLTAINHDSAASYPQYTRQPGIALSAFDGEVSFGNWSIFICDLFALDEGFFIGGFLDFIGTPIIETELNIEIYDPSSSGLLAAPGNDIISTINVKNLSDITVDSGSIEIIFPIENSVVFYNDDIDDNGPEADPVSFIDSSSGLSLNYPSDVAFSNSTSRPVNFTACNYSPTTGYDPAVTFLCVNPTGSMLSGDPDPGFSISFRSRIR